MGCFGLNCFFIGSNIVNGDKGKIDVILSFDLEKEEFDTVVLPEGCLILREIRFWWN